MQAKKQLGGALIVLGTLDILYGIVGLVSQAGAQLIPVGGPHPHEIAESIIGVVVFAAIFLGIGFSIGRACGK